MKNTQNNDPDIISNVIANNEIVSSLRTELENNILSNWSLEDDWNLEDTVFQYAARNQPKITSKEEDNQIIENIKNAYKSALSHFNTNQLDKAEQEFIEAIKPVLSKPSRKTLTFEAASSIINVVLDSMYHIGQIYLRNDKYPDHHTKAAAIFHYCAGFSKKHNATVKVKYDSNIAEGNTDFFINQAYLAEQKLLTELNPKKYNLKSNTKEGFYGEYSKKISFYKGELEEVRDHTKKAVSELKPIKTENILQRAKLTKNIYDNVSNFFVSDTDDNGLFQRLLQDCRDQLEKAPDGCIYSVIGLGSLAFGTMTPWSDIEFAIIVNEDREEFKDYLRRLTQLLQMKITNFGETIIPTLGIEAFNNFKTGEDQYEWFWDDIVKRGFSMDGKTWYACKSPLGRQGYKGKPDYELILTPKQLAEFQSDENDKWEDGKCVGDNYFATDKHLVQALKSVCLISGSQKLLDDYRILSKKSVQQSTSQIRSLSILKEDIDKFQINLDSEQEGKLLDVKKDIYRLTDRIITALADYYDISAEPGKRTFTTWEMIVLMAQKGIISKDGADHLYEALGIATELRLSTYLNNFGQKEMMSTYNPVTSHLSKEQSDQILGELFCIKDTSVLHHYYYVMLSLSEESLDLYRALSFLTWYKQVKAAFLNLEYSDVRTFSQPEDNFRKNKLFDDSDYNKSLVCARFLEYDKAILHMEKAIKNYPTKDDVYLVRMINLFNLYLKNDTSNTKIEKIAEEILAICEKNYKEIHPNTTAAYQVLICANLEMGKYNKAIDYCDKAIEVYLKIIDKKENKDKKYIEWECINKSSERQDIACAYNNKGITYKIMGLYDEAIKYYTIAFRLNMMSGGDALKIASIYNNLGECYREKGEYKKALEYYDFSKELLLMVHILAPNHPDIAMIYNNISTTYSRLYKFDEARDNAEHALKIYFNLYGEDNDNVDIARGYGNMSHAYSISRDKEQALYYALESFNMFKRLYKGDELHPYIADAYSNLGTCYDDMKNYELGTKSHEKALKICEDLYSKANPNHHYIAIAHNNLAAAYQGMGGKMKDALRHFKAAFDIYKASFGEDSKHPNMLGIKHNLISLLKRNLCSSIDDAVNFKMTIQDKGDIALVRKDFDSAITYYNEFLNTTDIRQNLSNTAGLYLSLSEAYSARNKLQESYDCASKALSIRKKIYEINPDHPLLALAYNNLGEICAQQFKYPQAKLYLEKAFHILSKTHHSSDKIISTITRNLGIVFTKNFEQIGFIKEIHQNKDFYGFLHKYLQSGISLNAIQVKEVENAYAFYEENDPSKKIPFSEFFQLYPYENNPDFFVETSGIYDNSNFI